MAFITRAATLVALVHQATEGGADGRRAVRDLHRELIARPETLRVPNSTRALVALAEQYVADPAPGREDYDILGGLIAALEIVAPQPTEAEQEAIYEEYVNSFFDEPIFPMPGGGWSAQPATPSERLPIPTPSHAAHGADRARLRDRFRPANRKVHNYHA